MIPAFVRAEITQDINDYGIKIIYKHDFAAFPLIPDTAGGVVYYKAKISLENKGATLQFL